MTREPAPDPSPAGLEPPALDGSSAVSRQVTDWLASRIIAGDVAPGTMLSENGLCALVGVSRQPVREALLRLSLGGLVRIHAQRGSMVTRISASAVRRAQMVREAVEGEALARAMARDAPGLARALAAEL
ncbi:MAG TPA: GntR family transcriptional regulator, partial [Rubellimicrobium sp.]|nr:GntR family transcriptional regulator [Rubellimicrobium sp.]